MPEFITVARRAGHYRTLLNVEQITRVAVNSTEDHATVSFDIDSMEISGAYEVSQLLAGIARASASSVAPEVAGSAVRDRLINLVGELKLECDEALNDYIPGLNHAIAHVQKIVDQYAEVR